MREKLAALIFAVSICGAMTFEHANAALIRSDFTAPLVTAAGGAGNTVDLRAVAIAGGETNVTRQDTGTPGVDVPLTNPDFIQMPATFFRAGFRYDPTRGIIGAAKPAAGITRTVTVGSPGLTVPPPPDESGNVPPYALASASIAVPAAAGSKPTLTVTSTAKRGTAQSPGPALSAAAEAKDPLTLSPGLYSYLVQFGNVTLTLDAGDESLGLYFFGEASDSPSSPIWQLLFTLDGTNPDALNVDLRFDPLYFPSVTDEVVQAAKANLLTFMYSSSVHTAQGVFSFTGPYNLFETNPYLNVMQTADFSFGVAAAAQVPEPGTLTLLLLPLVGLLLCRRDVAVAV